MRSDTFWALVRHEFKRKGSWRKRSRTPVAKWWWIAYLSIVLIAVIGSTTYFAIRETLQLDHIWYATAGFPFALFFIGVGQVKREWENDTYGWWLTLPYSRLRLVGAKWIGAWLRIVAIVAVVFAAATLYVAIIALFISRYTFDDVVSFAVSGLNWLLPLVGFSPLLLSLGMLLASAQHTSWRPLSPVLWVVVMSSGGWMYASLDRLFPENGMLRDSGAQMAVLFPYGWGMPAAVAASLVVSYAIVRLSAYLLEKKLTV
ncbi:ABC transporter permease [Paenibacillus flagellatus]|uniref:ABC transporter permease n=1 Tax=Paenibacillus flagellatus TaxID=2211139 RepID=A0A2V5K3U0_9BACL|nr:ABC transporter permease [Paenibacillus flagellatus]PYI53891.1 ABC transporter permease [Paenibacillus flagellatus]